MEADQIKKQFSSIFIGKMFVFSKRPIIVSLFFVKRRHFKMACWFSSSERHNASQKHGNRRCFSSHKLQQQRQTVEIVEVFFGVKPKTVDIFKDFALFHVFICCFFLFPSFLFLSVLFVPFHVPLFRLHFSHCFPIFLFVFSFCFFSFFPSVFSVVRTDAKTRKIIVDQIHTWRFSLVEIRCLVPRWTRRRVRLAHLRVTSPAFFFFMLSFVQSFSNKCASLFLLFFQIFQCYHWSVLVNFGCFLRSRCSAG